MKTIGQTLRNARSVKKYSLDRLEEITKIKSDFIDLVEKEKWDRLPPFPTVLGFVKSIANAVGVDERFAVAVLKRDYPPKKLRINPKPDISGKFSWSPRLTFAIGVGVVLAVIFGYLAFQYVGFTSKPRLKVESPKDGQTINGTQINVFGSTDSDVKITVNNQPVIVSDDGKFMVSLEVVADTHVVTIVATSRSGKVTTISRRITVQ